MYQPSRTCGRVKREWHHVAAEKVPQARHGLLAQQRTWEHIPLTASDQVPMKPPHLVGEGVGVGLKLELAYRDGGQPVPCLNLSAQTRMQEEVI